jgi:hypothetical protein
MLTLLDTNPKYSRIMAPYRVIINVLGTLPSANFNEAIAAYDSVVWLTLATLLTVLMWFVA